MTIILEALKDLFFPRKCLGCQAWGSYLCPDCLNFVKVDQLRLCPICQRPAVGGKTHTDCRPSQGLTGLTSLFVYQGIIKRGIDRLSNQLVTDLAPTLLELLLTFAGEDQALISFLNQPNVGLVPIPQHWLTKNWRGFNQAELLGKMVADQLAINFYPDLLIRKKRPAASTDNQKDLDVKNAFALNRLALKTLMPGQLNLILFDDLWKTGANMKECARLLKTNQVNQIWGLTLAREPVDDII